MSERTTVCQWHIQEVLKELIEKWGSVQVSKNLTKDQCVCGRKGVYDVGK